MVRRGRQRTGNGVAAVSVVPCCVRQSDAQPESGARFTDVVFVCRISSAVRSRRRSSPGHASRRQLVTVMSVCLRERLDEGACCRSSSRENGRASRSMSRYLFRVAAFRCGCAVSSFRLHCLAASRWDGIRWKPFFFIEYKLIFAGQLNSERYVHIACHTGI